MIKKILKALGTVIALSIICLNVVADENKTILKAVIDDCNIKAYVNTEQLSTFSVQLGNTACEVESAYKISDMPSDTLIMIDASGSIPKGMRDKTMDFVTALIDGKQDNEYYSIATFGTEINYLCDYTADRYELVKSLEKLSYGEKYTYIYSVLDSVIEGFAKESFGKIIIISDGVENSKDGITYDEILMSISENPCPIYTVGIENHNQEYLKKLYSFARTTSAESVTLSSDTDIETLCDIVNQSREYICVDIEIPTEAADGSVKYLQVSTEDFVCGKDIRTKLSAVPEITESVTSVTQDATVMTTVSEMSEPVDNSFKFNALIWVAAAVVVIIAVIIILLKTTTVNKSKNNVHVYDPVQVSDHKETKQHKSENPSGSGTRILIPSESEQSDSSTKIECSSSDCETMIDTGTQTVIILSDINSPAHSFRTAVGQGVIVGRSAEKCMVVIDYDGYVSRQHCRIFELGSKIYIKNLSNTKGTFVNNSEVTEKELHNGDVIKIGHTSLKLEIIRK